MSKKSNSLSYFFHQRRIKNIITYLYKYFPQTQHHKCKNLLYRHKYPDLSKFHPQDSQILDKKK